MKKIFTLIAAAAMLAVSCQNDITPEKGDSNITVEGKLTATIVQTKVSYNETSEMNLQPAWEVGDQIIGFDDAGNTYTLTVASVSAETATLSGTVPDGALHLIYKSGASASDISSKSLAIDYTAQKGDKTMPAVMLSDGTVENGACNFAFTNAGAIIGISAVNGVPSGSIISKVTIEGANLSAATVSLDGSTLKLTAATAATDAISTAALSGITTTDANGTLSSPVFIAVPAGAEIAKVTATVTKEPETTKIPSTAADKEGIDYVTIGGIKWAKWNLGANSETDYGWYFPWAGTEGYVQYANTWQSAKATSIEFSYTPSSPKTLIANDYVYVKTQIYKTSGHSFNYINTPYQTQNTPTQFGCKFTKYLGSFPYSLTFKDPSVTDADVLNLVLDPEDDAAHVNWGGSWHMPTIGDLSALINNTTKELKTDYNGTGVNGYLLTSNVTGEEGHSIFLPDAGFGYNSRIDYIISLYLSSSADEHAPTYFSAIQFNSVSDIVFVGYEKYVCGSVRPISD